MPRASPPVLLHGRDGHGTCLGRFRNTYALNLTPTRSVTGPSNPDGKSLKSLV